MSYLRFFKVIIGTSGFASVLVKVAAVPALLQLINGISKDLQKLLKYFNGIAIFTPFFLPLFPVLPIRFALYLNQEGLSIVKSTSPSISSL